MSLAAEKQTEGVAKKKPGNILKRMSRWVLHWAMTPYAVTALILIAVAESSFFPIPPDILLIAMAIALPKKSFKFAAICTIASVAGGALGYVFGIFLREPFEMLFQWMGYKEAYDNVLVQYRDYGALFTFIAALTPIPYKVFTIGAGVAMVNFPVFILASVLGRGLRFFAVGTMVYFFGAAVKRFIDKYFNLLTVVFTVLLVGFFVLLKFIF
jgi:membrane protein YqaA with SNARE-associated domain